jgi:hypothetical protein
MTDAALYETGGCIRAEKLINTWGTPNDILENFEACRKPIGGLNLTLEVSWGTPTETAAKNMERVAQKVLPELRSWQRH